MEEGDLIVCPSCARAHPPSERFCEVCGMPLVHPTDSASPSREYVASERQQTARKIKPQYTEGELVKVALAEHQPEAEFIAGLLLEEGIPCLLRNSIGGYSPMIGPLEIMVPASGAQAAREALKWERPA
jgi:Putative prokaryotic signal transducing protein